MGHLLRGPRGPPSSAAGSRTAGSAPRSWPASCAARWWRARTARPGAAPRRPSERIERLAGQPLGLVDDVDLLATLDRRGGRLLAELAGVLDAAVEAASISTTSRWEPSRIATHCSQAPQGSAVGPCSQLTIFARMRAVEVLPVPRGPQNRNAWCRRPSRIAPVSARTTWSWPDHLGGASAAGTAGRAPGALSVRHAPSASRPPRRRKVTVHPPSTTDDSVATRDGSSSQASLRHPPASAYGCFLPDLTGFAFRRRAGPDLQRSVPRAAPDLPGLGRGFSPAEADRGYRAPLAPRLARSPAEYTWGLRRAGPVTQGTVGLADVERRLALPAGRPRNGGLRVGIALPVDQVLPDVHEVTRAGGSNRSVPPGPNSIRIARS